MIRVAYTIPFVILIFRPLVNPTVWHHHVIPTFPFTLPWFFLVYLSPLHFFSAFSLPSQSRLSFRIGFLSRASAKISESIAIGDEGGGGWEEVAGFTRRDEAEAR